MSWFSTWVEHRQGVADCVYLWPGVKVVLSPVEAGGYVSSQVGGTVSLTCTVEGRASGQDEKLEWYRNGHMVQLNPNNRHSPSRLCLQNLTTDDHLVTYTCHLKKNFTVSASAKVNVLCECGGKAAETC